MSDGSIPGATPPQPTPTPAPPAQPWYQSAGADTDTIAYLQNRGWTEDPAKAAINAAKAHREAEKLLGVPAEQILKLPKQEDTEGWKGVWQRLGAAKDKAEYDFSTVKFADGSDLDDTFAGWLRDQADAMHLSKDAASRLASQWVQKMDEVEKTELAANSLKIETAKRNLQSNWGPNFDANLHVARQGAKALGVDPETVQQLENVAGYDKVMEMFRKIGEINGEDKFVRGANQTGGGVMTKEQASGRISELKNDKAWMDRYFAGGAVERKEMDGLSAILASSQSYDPRLYGRHA